MNLPINIGVYGVSRLDVQRINHQINGSDFFAYNVRLFKEGETVPIVNLTAFVGNAPDALQVLEPREF